MALHGWIPFTDFVVTAPAGSRLVLYIYSWTAACKHGEHRALEMILLVFLGKSVETIMTYDGLLNVQRLY